MTKEQRIAEQLKSLENLINGAIVGAPIPRKDYGKFLEFFRRIYLSIGYVFTAKMYGRYSEDLIKQQLQGLDRFPSFMYDED